MDSGKDVNVICETIVHGAHKVDTIYHQMKHMNCNIVFYHEATKIEHDSKISSRLSLEVWEFIMSHLQLGLYIPQSMANT